MSAAARRSVKDIDPRSLEIAETLARQSGLSLPEWIDTLMARKAKAEEGPVDAAATLAPDVAGRANTGAQSMDETMRAALARLVDAGHEQLAVASRVEDAVQALGSEQSKLADRLRRVETEGGGLRSTDALRSLEATLGKMAGHIHGGEGRTHEAIGEVTAKLRRLDAGPASAAPRIGAVAALTSRLDEVEKRAFEVLGAVQNTLGDLDERIGGLALTASQSASVERLEALARESADDLGALGRAVEALESRLAAATQAASDGASTERQDTLAARWAEEIGALQRSILALEARVEEVGRAAAEAASIDRLAEVEARTTHILRGLGTSLDTLDARVGAIEANPSGKVLAAQVDEAQATTAEQLREVAASIAAVEARLGKMEASGSQAVSMSQLQDVVRDLADRIDTNPAAASIVAVEARLAAMEASGSHAVSMSQLQDVVRDLADRIDANPATAAISQRLDRAQAQTAETLRDLAGSIVAVDARLGGLEANAAGLVSAEQMQDVVRELYERVESQESSLADSGPVQSAGRIEAMERGLLEVAEGLVGVEQRARGAVENIGRDVLELSHSLVERLESSERRNAEAIEDVGAEVSRVSQTIEVRLERADTVQALALEKLGEEISRISERLAERIASADRRSAEAIETVGDQMARVTERLSQRNERNSEDLAERIRLSEERTTRVLRETRQEIERLGSVRRRDGDHPAHTLAVLDDDQEHLFGEDPFVGFAPPPPATPPLPSFSQEDLDAAEDFSRLAPAEEAAEAEQADQAEHAEPHTPYRELEAVSDHATDVGEDLIAPPSASDDADEPAPDRTAGFEAEAEAEAEVEVEADAEAEAEAEGEGWPGDFAEGSESHRLEALFEDTASEPPPAEEAPDAVLLAPEETPEPWNASGRRGVREAVSRARAAALAAAASPRAFAADSPPIFSSRPFSAGLRRSGGATLALGLAAAFGLAMGGFWFLQGEPRKSSPQRVASLSTSPNAPSPNTTAPAASPQMAVALTPAARATTPYGAAARQDFATSYASAIGRVAAQDGRGLEDLRQIALLGYGPAELYLAKLYETGGAGLKVNPVMARVWTQKAAWSGDARAMHNLALDLFEGDGVAKNPGLAVQWFTQAANLGIVDSQYNLGRLYETGAGVALNQAEAYKWYLIAAHGGDPQAQQSAARVAPQLDPSARSAAERSAAAFRSTGPSAAAAGEPQAPNAVETAQQRLAALGYYRGPHDGVASTGLRLALGAYQRANDLPATGAPDPATIAKLSATQQ